MSVGGRLIVLFYYSSNSTLVGHKVFFKPVKTRNSPKLYNVAPVYKFGQTLKDAILIFFWHNLAYSVSCDLSAILVGSGRDQHRLERSQETLYYAKKKSKVLNIKQSKRLNLKKPKSQKFK